MQKRELSKVESELDVKLPPVVRAFLRDHGQELRDASKTLRDQVVLETRSGKSSN